MIWTPTSTSSNRSIRNYWTIPGPIPSGLYSNTTVGRSDDVYEVPIDDILPGKEKRAEEPSARLRSLYEISGLTWKEIALLFGVSERAVHSWLCAEKKMLPEKADLLSELIEFVVKIDRGRPYKTRKLIRENLRTNARLLGLVRSRNFEELLLWAESLPTALPTFHPAVSEAVLKDRLPPDLLSMLSASERDIKVIGVPKVTAARVARLKRK